MAKHAHSILILKIHTGIHESAEFLLEEQDYIIGSSYDNDIILQDSTVAPKHAKIQVLNQKIYITPFEDAIVLLNATPITQITKIQHQDIIELKNIVISIHKINDIGKIKSSQNRITSIESKKVLNRLNKLYAQIEEIKGISSSQNGTNTVYPEQASNNIMPSIDSIASVIAMPIFLTLIVIMSIPVHFIPWTSSVNGIGISESDIVESIDTINSVEERLSNYFYQISPELELVFNHAEKTLNVEGYVKDQKTKMLLLKSGIKNAYHCNVKVYIVDSMLENIRNIIYESGFNGINIYYNGQGAFTLKGLINSDKNIHTLTHLIHSDILGIRKLYIELIPIKQLGQQIQSVSISNNKNKSYIKTTDNKKRYIGSYLLPNTIITDILKNYIELKYHEKIIKYNFVSGQFIDYE